MPYVNWSRSSVSREFVPHSRFEKSMRLRFASTELAELADHLDRVLETQAELRMDLPSNVIVFWKTRETETRLLLAHPEPEQWVATAALEPQHGRRLIERLRALEQGQEISLSELGPIAAFSNLEIVISLN